MTVAELRADVVILACAVSAGIHAALVREHLSESAAAGAGFAVAAVALAACAVALTRAPSRPAFAAAGVVLAGLIASYLLAVTTGVPLLHPGPEPVDALAVVTKAVEAVGLVVTAGVVGRPSAPFLHPKGIVT